MAIKYNRLSQVEFHKLCKWIEENVDKLVGMAPSKIVAKACEESGLTVVKSQIESAITATGTEDQIWPNNSKPTGNFGSRVKTLETRVDDLETAVLNIMLELQNILRKNESSGGGEG